MAGVNVSKRVNNKIWTENAILRLKNGSYRVLNREKLNEKFKARIRQERQNILNEKRNLASTELRKIASEVLKDEYAFGSPINSGAIDESTFSLEEELLIEEALEEEFYQEYEDWVDQEYENFLSADEPSDDLALVCPVCCRQCFRFTSNSIECDQCHVAYPPIKTVEVLRSDVNTNLADHNSNCCRHPQFATVPDSNGRNTLLIVCHACSYLNVLL